MLMRILTNRWVHIFLLLSLLGGSVFVRMQDYKWGKSLSFAAFDAFNSLQPRASADLVAMVDIDESSLQRPELGQWPWPRNILAQLVTNLHEMGARAIVFDMVFAEADRTSAAEILNHLPEGSRPPAVDEFFAQIPDNDDVFANAIKDAGNVVLGFTCAEQSATGDRMPHQVSAIVARNAKEMTALDRPISKYERIAISSANAINLDKLVKSAAGVGSFCVKPDHDGIIRRVPLMFLIPDQSTGSKKGILYPSLALEALRVAQSSKTVIKVRSLKDEAVPPFMPSMLANVGKYDIPIDPDAHIYAYFTPARPAKYIPAWRVLNKEIDRERISGKIVFIGTSAAGLKDIRSTPLDLYVPGVEVHMNIAEQILTDDYLVRSLVMQGAETLGMIAVGCLIIILSPFIGAIYLALFTMAIIMGTGLLSWYCFAEKGILVDPAYTSLTVLLIFIASTLLTYIRTEYERARVRQAFGLYISPDFMRELTSDPEKLKLGGETRELTVMFTDIRGFTTISESMSPEALIQLMNSFLTPMSDLVMETRGTIDKYMGDAMMAFWNAPLDDAEHARHACTAALRMYQALAPVNEELKLRAQAERRPPVVLNAGIGINTGTASVGNMGSRQRFAYSALGDTVNLASRLEGQTKAYGVNVLISEATYKHIPDFACLELDLIRVKGKLEPVRIFTLLGEQDRANSEEFRAWKQDHDAMMLAYRAREFTTAVMLAEKCRVEHGEEIEGFYAMFAARIGELRVRPPEEGWDGVYIATSK